MADILQQAGFRGNALNLARAVMSAESHGNPNAHNTNAGTGDNSYGLFQINMLGNLGPARLKQYGLKSNDDLLDPATNARVAYQMSKGGTDWSPWSTYKSGAYKSYLGKGTRVNIPPGTVPLTGKGVDTPAQAARTIPGSPNRQALFSSLLSGLDSFAKTGKATSSAPGTALDIMHNAMDQIQIARGSARATFVADQDAGPVHDPAGLITEAKKWLGTPYSWGGGGTKGPSKGFGRGANTVGFDCSSFIQYLYGKKGVNVPRTTYSQWKAGTPVDMKNLQPGDAVYADMTSQGPGHVGMYIGHGQVIQAPHTGDVVKISNLNGFGAVGARRFG